MATIYWLSTSIISILLSLSSYTYIFHKGTIDGIRELGFPDFFRIELAVLKILAVLVLLIPNIPLQVKGWAYAGVGLFYITSIVAHIAHKDSISTTILNVLFFAILAVSYIYLHKLSTE